LPEPAQRVILSAAWPDCFLSGPSRVRLINDVGGQKMNDEALNMSIRKFLKTVGVNSQLAIEKAVQKAIAEGKLKGSEAFPAAMTLAVGRLDLNIKFDGEIRLE
jgi:hypothetical protein